MDLDEQELKVTREKSADELFDDEGMWLESEDRCALERMNDDYKVIRINKITAEIECYSRYSMEVDTITIPELKAIYKYCQEKGWI